MNFWNRFALLLGVLSVAFAIGCSTTDEPDNVSERPWNAPKGWEHGLPTGLMEGR